MLAYPISEKAKGGEPVAPPTCGITRPQASCNRILSRVARCTVAPSSVAFGPTIVETIGDYATYPSSSYKTSVTLTGVLVPVTPPENEATLWIEIEAESARQSGEVSPLQGGVAGITTIHP